MQRPFLKLFRLACVGAAIAASACAGPPPGPPIVLHRVTKAGPIRPRVTRSNACEPVAQDRLTEAQKASLFEGFDDYQRGRRPAGAPAKAELPPPGPLPKSKVTVNRACPGVSP